MSRWWNNPEILAIIGRQVAEIHDLADRISRAQAAFHAYLVRTGKIPAA